MHAFIRLSLVSWLGLAGIACGDRVVAGELDSDEDEQPDGPNQLYAACEIVDDCGNLDTCVFPEGEEGFCSIDCTRAEECGESPGGSVIVDCVSVGLEPPRTVCALDCGRGRTCPAGMACRAVATNDGDRDICF